MTTTKKRPKRITAFHNDPKLKQEVLARVRRHRKADQLRQGYGYWRRDRDGEFRGCALGCITHSNSDSHSELERQFGIIQVLGCLIDALFEGQSPEKAQHWPERIVTAIPVGLSDAWQRRVFHRFFYWLLTKSDLLSIDDENREAIAAIAKLHHRAAAGGRVSQKQWIAAEGAAWRVGEAWSVEAAAWSVEAAAWSEDALIAADVVSSAVDGTVGAARITAHNKTADALVRFVREAGKESK